MFARAPGQRHRATVPRGVGGRWQRAFALPVALTAVAIVLQGCSVNDVLTHLPFLERHGDGTASSESLGGSIQLSASAWGGGFRLSALVRPFAAGRPVAEPQRLVLDTGSSTLAFCDSELAAQVQNLQTSYLSCNEYGVKGKDSENTSYWGNFYRGSIIVGNETQIDGVFYSIMQAQTSMPCTNGLQGIFGIAFAQLDQAFSDDSQEAQSLQSGASTNCPAKASVDLEPPLLSAFKQDAGAKSLGIYWSGKLGENTGNLYLGKSAENNKHVTAGTLVGSAALGELGWYDISIQEISLPSLSYTLRDIPCKPGSYTCILDTGTPMLMVPPEVADAFNGASVGESDLGVIRFTLDGAVGGEPVVLEFPLADFVQRQWISAGPKGSGVILGLPLWATYYTVMRLEQKSVSFVQLPGSPDAVTTAPGWSFWPLDQNLDSVLHATDPEGNPFMPFLGKGNSTASNASDEAVNGSDVASPAGQTDGDAEGAGGANRDPRRLDVSVATKGAPVFI